VKPRYDGVLFDLLTALLDSWTLWNAVAGGEEAGRRWRAAYLRNTYGTGVYRSYETLVTEAAVEVGLPSSLAAELANRYGELRPWPEVPAVLGALRPHVKLAVVTNCSQVLTLKAAACTGGDFAVIVSAERAGFYKPDPRPYRRALAELGLAPEKCLFVAGSSYDLFGTAAVGLPTFWHDPVGMALPQGAPPPLVRHRSLAPLVECVLGN
jgi:2-haloalkanoic acid dehalogenase type II